MREITVYSDYKSPYAYLAKAPARELARDFDVRLNWLPYVLDIPSYLGSAELNQQGELVTASRNAHQWRRVRYSYMDCRRQARQQGLTILGTRKIWDSSLAAIGMLWAKRQGGVAFNAYHDLVFERFWRRELDIEDAAVITACLDEAGAVTEGFTAFLAGPGRTEHDKLHSAAEEAGVFGVPSFVLDGELYWGREHLAEIRARLSAPAK